MSHESITDEIRELSALYSVDALDPDRTAEFERHLESGCSTCSSELLAFQDTAAQLAFSLPAQNPGARVRERLMDRIAPRPEIPRVLVRAHEGTWLPLGADGVTWRPLFTDESTGNITSLVKLEPGAVYPAHRHFGLEHCYVLEGDVVFNDHVLQAGDYEVAMASTAHSTVTSAKGCLLLIINNQRDEVLPT